MAVEKDLGMFEFGEREVVSTTFAMARYSQTVFQDPVALASSSAHSVVV